MENVTDALIIAASVLLLIIALSVNIFSFTNIKTQVDGIISERDEIDMATDISGNYINYYEANDSNAVRTVGIETVMSSIMRVEKESYTVYIYDKNDSSLYLNEKIKKLVVKNSKEKKFGGTEIKEMNDIIKISIDGGNYKNLTDDTMEALYNNLKGKTFDEYIGEYQDNSDKSSANKQTYRVITFVVQ